MQEIPPHHIIRFGRYELNIGRCELRKGRIRVRLQEKPFRVLAALARRPGEVVTRAELQKELWPGETFVDFEDGLNTAVKKVREALSDDSENPRFIQTVPRRGYRFLPTVSSVPENARLAAVPQSLSWGSAETGLQVTADASALAGPPETQAGEAITAVREPVSRFPAALRARTVKVIAALLLLLIAALMKPVWHALGLRTSKSTTMHPRPLTTLPGGEYEPSFSPAGDEVVFVWGGAGNDDFNLYIKSIREDRTKRITNNVAGSPSWSRDGKRIAFIRYSENPSISGIYVTPSHGGPEKRIAPVFPLNHIFERHLDWSPAADILAVVDKGTADDPFAICLLSSDTEQRRQLTLPPPHSFGDTSPSFAPDGKMLAFRRTMASGVSDLYVTGLAGGVQRLTTDNAFISDLAWCPDGKSIVFSSSRSGLNRLWRIFIADRRIEPVSVGEGAYFIATSRAGNRLAYSRSFADSNIWRLMLTNDAKKHQERIPLIASTLDDRSPQYSPDGSKIAFRSNRSGSDEIWVSDSDGFNALRITSFEGPLTGTPRWSPQSLLIALDSRPSGNADIYAVSSTGSGLRRVTTDPAEDVVPSWSTDGRSIYFASNRGGSWQMWKVSLPGEAAGEKAVQITQHGGFGGFESKEGKWLYYAKGRELPGIWRVPAEGGDESIVLSALPSGYWGYWSLTKDGIFFLEPSEHGQCAIRFYSFAGRNTETIAILPKEPPFGDSGFSVSADGRNFLYVQVDYSQSDIFLVEDFH